MKPRNLKHNPPTPKLVLMCHQIINKSCYPEPRSIILRVVKKAP